MHAMYKGLWLGLCAKKKSVIVSKHFLQIKTMLHTINFGKTIKKLK